MFVPPHFQTQNLGLGIEPTANHKLALCQGPRSCRAIERYKRVLIGWHCDKVQGHAELEIEKPRVKTLG